MPFFHYINQKIIKKSPDVQNTLNFRGAHRESDINGLRGGF